MVACVAWVFIAAGRGAAEQARQGARDEGGERPGDRAPRRQAGQVGDHGIDEAGEREPARGREPGDRVLHGAEGADGHVARLFGDVVGVPAKPLQLRARPVDPALAGLRPVPVRRARAFGHGGERRLRLPGQRLVRVARLECGPPQAAQGARGLAPALVGIAEAVVQLAHLVQHLLDVGADADREGQIVGRHCAASPVPRPCLRARQRRAVTLVAPEGRGTLSAQLDAPGDKAGCGGTGPGWKMPTARDDSLGGDNFPAGRVRRGPLELAAAPLSAPDVSAHRILSDISAFIGHEDPSRHRILAAGDLNMIYGATGRTLALPERERAFWDRVAALGLEFLGPQAPDGWQPSAPQPDVPADTKNVPTWVRNGLKPEQANRQLDYAIASRGFHGRVKVRALNRSDEWGPSDHCRLMIEVATE